MEAPISYEEAYKELRAIAMKIELEEITMDEIPDLIERSKWLVQFCESKLQGIEQMMADDIN